MDDHLHIKDNRLIFQNSHNQKWEIEISRLRFVGEYTTASGPGDDYYFVFSDKENEWWQAPSIAVKHETFWDELGKKLNAKIAPNLFYSTQWATSVIWPKELEGEQLYKIVSTENEPQTFWEKILGIEKKGERLELTDKVKKLFE